MWKTTKVLMLPKPNKIDNLVVKYKREISFLNNLGKTCETVVVDKLVDWCVVYHVIYK